MGEFEIVIARDKYIELPVGTTNRISFYFFMPDKKSIDEILYSKRARQLSPSFYRVRLYYKMRLDCAPGQVGANIHMYLIDKNGCEREIDVRYPTFMDNMMENDIDVSSLFRGKPAPLGIQALIVSSVDTGFPLTPTYHLKVYEIKIYGTWGW